MHVSLKHCIDLRWNGTFVHELLCNRLKRGLPVAVLL